MTISDQCRALACQQFAAAACPIIPRTERAALQEAAAWNEQMATEIDALDAIALRALPFFGRRVQAVVVQ